VRRRGTGERDREGGDGRRRREKRDEGLKRRGAIREVGRRS